MVPVLKYTHILVHKGAHNLGDFRKCSYGYQAINLVEPLKQTNKKNLNYLQYLKKYIYGKQ